jgi:hypothetical protein
MPTWQYFFIKAMDSWRKFGPDKNGNSNYSQKAINFLSWINKKTDKILAIWLEGLFWARNKVGCSFFLLDFGFGLWKLSHYARPKVSILILYWLFLAIFFGLSTKFGHSIPRPLDLDGHSVKRPYDFFTKARSQKLANFYFDNFQVNLTLTRWCGFEID